MTEEYNNYNKEELVYEDKVCIAIMPKKGPTSGYIKVIPKQKCKTLAELDEEVRIQLFYAASFAATAVFEGLGAQGTNIIVHDGDYKKDSDYQLELLVIPRKENDGVDFKWETTDASQEDLDDTKNRISEETFLIGKETKPTTVEESSTQQPKPEEPDDDGENYFIKHLIRIP